MSAPDIMGRTPPHNLDAEAAVLATVLADHRKLDAVTAIVQPDQFYSDANRRALEAAVDLRRRGTPADLQTVAAWLRDRDWLQAVGGIGYLSRLIDATPAVSHVEAYAKIVRDKARVRTLIDACQFVAAGGFGDYGDADAYLAEAESRIYAATRVESDREATHIADLIDDEVKRINRVRDGQEDPAGIPFGFTALDALLGGGQPGEVTVVAGRPGSGKTAFATNALLNVAVSDHAGTLQCSFLASLEMTNRQIARRAIGSFAQINVRRFERGQETPAELDRWFDRVGRLRELPIWVDDRVRMTPAQLRAHIRRLQAKYDKPSGVGGKPQRVSFVMVDYLQRMGADRSKRERREEVSECMNAVADAAKECGVHVVLLAQINRENTKGQTSVRRPRMSDLAESGEIEKAAHNIVLLHRPEYHEQDKDRVPENVRGLAEVIVDKQRDGATGIVRLAFDAEHALFRDPTSDEMDRWSAGARVLARAPKGPRHSYGGDS